MRFQHVGLDQVHQFVKQHDQRRLTGVILGWIEADDPRLVVDVWLKPQRERAGGPGESGRGLCVPRANLEVERRRPLERSDEQLDGDWLHNVSLLIHRNADRARSAASPVAATDRAYARIAPKWWPANAGGALVIPRRHVENPYEMEQEDGHGVWDLTRQVAKAMRFSYDCEGVSTRQHNEPAGDQDVWHLHVHVLPRFSDDRLYQRHRDARWVHVDERRSFGEKLRAVLRLPTTFG